MKMQMPMQKAANEITICRLCLEPVTNFICIDCLLVDIEEWGFGNEKFDESLHQKIIERHNELKELVHTESNGGICVVCRNSVEAIACPCCYLYEMFLVVKAHDPKLGEELERYFNFDFVFHHGFTQFDFWKSLHDRMLPSKHKFKAVLIAEKQARRDMNICDGCEQESDDLAELNGQWLCESCRDSELPVVV